MPINLVKGQNHVLNMNIFHVGLGWDVNEDASSDDDFDLDVSAFMVNATHKFRKTAEGLSRREKQGRVGRTTQDIPIYCMDDE